MQSSPYRKQSRIAGLAQGTRFGGAIGGKDSTSLKSDNRSMTAEPLTPTAIDKTKQTGEIQ